MRLISAAGADKAFVHSPTTAGPSLGCARERGIHVLRSRRKERARARERRKAERREKERAGRAKDRAKHERDRMTGVAEGRRERKDEKKRDRESGYPGVDRAGTEGGGRSMRDPFHDSSCCCARSSMALRHATPSWRWYPHMHARSHIIGFAINK